MYGEVRRVERLTPSLVRVVLGGPGLDSFEMADGTDAYINVAIPPVGVGYGPIFDPGQVKETEPRDAQPARRRYTVRRWDAATGELTLDFVVHGDTGVAGPWAAAATPGDVLVFTGPSSGYRPSPEADVHLLMGDESAFPSIAASLEAMPAGAHAVAVLVCDGPEHRIDLPGSASVHWLDRNGEVAQLAEAVAALDLPPGRIQAFVHGEAEEIREVRRHLLGERGLTRSDMSCSPYWRRTMTDEAWRAVKRDFVAAMESDA